MKTLRTLVMSGVVAVAGLLATSPAQAAGGFVIGPNGVRIYVDDVDYYHRYGYDRDDYYDRYHYRYRPCRDRVYFDWRRGYRVRVVERICYNRWGRAYVADRDYYRDYRYRYRYPRYDSWYD